MDEIKAPGIRKCLVDVRKTEVTLVRLIVYPEQRRRGHGGRILDKVKAIARAQRRPLPVRLTLDPETPDKRDDLIRFYKRHGFAIMSDNETMIWKP